MQVGTTKDQGLYNKPSAAVHLGALAAGTLPKYNTICMSDCCSKPMGVVTLCRAEMEQTCVGSQERTRKHRVVTPNTHSFLDNSQPLQRSRAIPCYSEHSGQRSALHFRTHYSLAKSWCLLKRRLIAPHRRSEPQVLDCPAPILVHILTELSRRSHSFVQINALVQKYPDMHTERRKK